MNKNFVITVSRQFGSGGRIIAKKIAEKLGVGFYDKELIEMTAKESGFDKDFVAQTEERVKNKFFHNMTVGGYHLGKDFGEVVPSAADKLFFTTADVITKIASEPCVIVGRCADYILKESKNVFNIYIYADAEKRLERAKNEYNLSDIRTAGDVLKRDKQRANHYSYYTSQTWGEKGNYHLLLDSGALGDDGSIETILTAIKARFS